MTTIVVIKGTHCKACKLLIEDICKEMNPTSTCTVDFQTGETIIEHEESFDWRAFKKEIEGLGPYRIESIKQQ